ncbi:MAG: hypothetical protein M3Y91_18530, partial [Actinomycetota bacterium]|nr:hypothetical protein [Actinomycetota bacterium]
GGLPFNFEHAGAILRAHLELEPVRPTGMPDALWSLVAGCMAKDPETRPEAATAALDLERLVGDLAGVAPLSGRTGLDATSPSPVQPASPATVTAAGIPLPPLPPAQLFPAQVPPEQVPPWAALDAAEPGWDRTPRFWGGPPVDPAGPGDHQPDPAAGDDLMTRVSSLPLAPAPVPEPPGGHSPRWSRRARLGALVASVLVAVGAGIGVALNWPGPTPTTDASTGITATVTATGVGAVKVAWADLGSQQRFWLYLLRRDGTVNQPQPPPGATTVILDGVPTGSHCFQVYAVFHGRLPAGLARSGAPAACVTVR